MSIVCPAPAFLRKIVSLQDLAQAAARLPHPVVFTNGVFDILHRGHVTYLAQARALGASLVVAVNSDSSVRQLGKGPDRPVNGEEDRAAVLAALECVDLVVVFPDKVPLEAVRLARPDLYVKGGDYEVEDLPEAKLAAQWGGKACTIRFDVDRSTTALLRRIRAAEKSA